MREKIRLILQDERPDDDDFKFIHDLPDDLEELTGYLQGGSPDLTKDQRTLAVRIRQMADTTKHAHRGAGRTHKATGARQSSSGAVYNQEEDDDQPVEAIDDEAGSDDVDVDGDEVVDDANRD